MEMQSGVHEQADARLPRIGDIVAGKYRVEGFIARGGMGIVLSARHQVTGRRMALKWLLYNPAHDAEATHRLVREAQAAARVRHPNVVDVYDVGEHDGSLFLVMELLLGETLSALLKERGVLGASNTLELLLPAMRGVEAAHRSQVVHRDLKPSNIFLCREPGATEVTPRVLDFGISKILSKSGDGEQSLTRTGEVLGTPQYMAPEQLTSEQVDARVDVYALGVILYQCLSGRLPFHDSNYNALVVQIATTSPTHISQLRPHLPAALGAAVMRAMARDRAARFQSVAELIEALLPFCTDGKAVSERAGHEATRAPSFWAIALLASLIGLTAAWVMWQRLGEAKAAPAAVTSTPAKVAALPVAKSAPPLQAPAAAVAPPLEPVPQPALAGQGQGQASGSLSDAPRAGKRAQRRSPSRAAEQPSAAAASELPPPSPRPVPISIEEF